MSEMLTIKILLNQYLFINIKPSNLTVYLMVLYVYNQLKLTETK
jgi:hypothetical protein